MKKLFSSTKVLFGVIMYIRVWTPHCGEILQLEQEFGNSNDAYSVAFMKDELVVGHLP